MDRTKIAIIIPYFGKFPDWIDLYLFSCSKNSFIDFLFFTDCDIPHKVYSNTFFFKTTFKEYCERVSQALEIKFAPQSPYKLCDLKVFYGIIHENELQDYDYWGFGDLDLVYGDLSIVVNKTTLKKYNLITTHADRVAGHFTIIKRESKYSTYCLMIKNWKDKLEDQIVLGLDEHDFTALIYPIHKWVWRLHRLTSIHHYKLFAFFNAITRLFRDISIKEYYTSPLPKSGETWVYDIKKNKIIAPNNSEIPYLHFLFFKKTPFWDNENYWKDGFYHISDNFESNKGALIVNNEGINYKQ